MWYKSLQLIFVDLLDSLVELALQLVGVRSQEVIEAFEFAVFVEGKNRDCAVKRLLWDFEFVHVDDFLPHYDKVQLFFRCGAAEFDVPVIVNFDGFRQDEYAVVHSFAAVYAEVTIEDVYHALAGLYVFEILVEIAEL